METTVQNIAQLTRRRIVKHLAWWLLFGLTMAIPQILLGRQDIVETILQTLVSLIFYGMIYYINAEYLIPKYLARDYFWGFLGLLITISVVLTPIKIMVLSLLFPENLLYYREMQVAYQVVSLLFAVVSTVIKITSDWTQQTKQQQEAENQIMQSELNFLKSQINPHFLFNTLNSLYALTLKKSDDAPEIVLKLSEMMRYMLYECNEKSVRLEKEITYLQNYLELEKLRLGKKMDIRIDTEGGVGVLDIAPLMLIPFVENAFKHGATNTISKGFVFIHILIADGELNFYIENSKPETPPARDPLRKSGGIGLANVRRRLELLYAQQHKLEITEKPDTYAVNLWLKLR